MKRLDTGEFVADEEFIREEKHNDALIREVIGDLKYLCLDDQIAGLCYGINGWKLMFYGNAIEKTIDITNKILETKVKVIENVKVKETVWRERPVMGGIDIYTGRDGLTSGTIGWVANKSDSSSRGIITVEHAVVVNGWVNNDSELPSNRIATTEIAVNNVFVDASYSPFDTGIDGSPYIKNLGNIVGWLGWLSIPRVGFPVSFNGLGSGGRRDTVTVDKGYIADKYQQIAIEQEL